VYYAYFIPIYRTEFARIGHETAAAARDAGGRTIADRLGGVPYSLGITIGTPALLFAALGAVVLAARHTGDRLTLAIGGWMLACALFLALGVLTPVDMRYYLAALPAVAITAGTGAAWAWDDEWARPRLWWRLGAAGILAGLAFSGFHAWWGALG
jgi:4-amino-4-deoxy-L-arabinose transferase-like glycosyltransferase